MDFFITFFLLAAIQEKFCINCRHAKPDFFGATYSKCTLFPEKDTNQVEYLVTGKPHSQYFYCSTARKSDQMCGPEGKYYAKKCRLIDIKLN